MRATAGWGRYPVADTDWVIASTPQAAAAETARCTDFIPRGNGRSYGDAAIGQTTTLALGTLDRMRSFDPATGLLTVEAGVLLADIIATFMPRGFFPMVVPGTRFVTVGGAIASDIHGKNHHRDGSFGDHVAELELAMPDGSRIVASRNLNPEIFQATLGGMGLTGVILSATFRLRPIESGWIRQTTLVAPDLAAAIGALDQGDAATYSVAWIDCLARGSSLGRSLIYLGEHAGRAELHPDRNTPVFPEIRPARLSVPFDLPAAAINRWSIGLFNEAYFRAGAAKSGAPYLVPADPYFFPLDSIGAWNRIYGRRGFVQHQSVLPPDTAPQALQEILERISARGSASFLAVLKKLGASQGLLSFARPGYTLALDFPFNRDLLTFLDELDRIVVRAGGRLYLAKDSRQSRATFEAGYDALPRFHEIRRHLDPHARLRSRLSHRLGL